MQDQPNQGGDINLDLNQSVLDRQVEGYHGAPLAHVTGVHMSSYLDSGSRTGTGTRTGRTESSRASPRMGDTPDLLTPTHMPTIYFRGWDVAQDENDEPGKHREEVEDDSKG